MSNHYPFELQELPYPTNALEPFIDEETVIIHHTKHQKKYVDTLNKVLDPYTQYHSWSLEKLLRDYRCLPSKIQNDVKNNAGGVYNHNIYFNLMSNLESKPSGMLLQAIKSQFGSVEALKEKLKQEALSQFGSGYAWLAVNNSSNLSIEKTSNQDSIISKNLYPVLVVDVWEHAYYLKYQNRRDEYFDNWFKLIDWNKSLEAYKFVTNNNKKTKHNK